MNLRTLAILSAALVACGTATIDHDKIEPFPQPEPVTVSEKAAIKFKPQLATSRSICVPFPAVNAAGEITGGLKGTNGDDACKYAPKGSQIYGRSGWYRDVWAIMYAWYFPKGFSWTAFPNRRHDWQSVVVWIDNPALESPKIVGASTSKSDTNYFKDTKMWPYYFAGYQSRGVRSGRASRLLADGSNTTLRFKHAADPDMEFSSWDGEFQDLIMWEQLTDGARGALNDGKNFGDSEVPFNDDHFEKHLDKAWPF
ncbi:hypothetical protein PHMEG_00041827 [Phytophthora megakarya]|uniref:Necrosis inducing protein NPP1 n=1 Tax=Phytophthora megakarya TaxID=4795 RepID=A0A225UDJ3_9STRA|nr:hypothetical protein PHMEG_00041827 [Phytophthora megakarya]